MMKRTQSILKDDMYLEKKNERFTRVQDFGAHLKGLGGLCTSHIKALKGSTFGAANEGRRLDPAERKAIEERLRKEGKLC